MVTLARRLLSAGRALLVTEDYLRARIRSSAAPSVGLAVCALFKDEAPYLAEWITFHRLVGVERFYLYNNDSADDWAAAIGPELSAGIASVVPWHRPPRGAQLSAYEDCLRRHRADTRWIAFIDIDEFLFSPSGVPLPDVLSHFAERPGVLAAWKIFGTGGHLDKPDGLVTENYLLRAADDHPEHSLAKPIIDPRRTYRRLGMPQATGSPHLMRHFGARRFWQLHLTPYDDGATHTGSGEERPVATPWLRINHYRSKSLSEARQKALRQRALPIDPQPLEDIVGAEFDSTRDETILRFLPELREQLHNRQKLSASPSTLTT
jgi:hypothetical protein